MLRRRRTINAGLTRFTKRESPIFIAAGTEIETVKVVAGGGIEPPTQGFSVLYRVALPRSALFGFVLASAAEYPIFAQNSLMHSERSGTIQNEKNRTESGQSKASVRLAKTHQGYWSAKLKKRSYAGAGGLQIEIPEWQVRIQHLGRESWFNLHTTNKTAAAAKARDIYVSLFAVGWDETLAKFKPESVESISSPTVGEFLDDVERWSGIKPGTFAIYARKFRTLVAGAMNLPSDINKHDYVGDGYKKWLQAVNFVKLARLTPAKIQEW